MSKTIRKQLFETMDTLFEVHPVLDSLCEKRAEEQLIVLLADCQDCAITIGTKIDTVFGEGKECVHKLEIYCEKLYLILQNATDLAWRREMFREARILLEQIKQLMEQELPNKTEILFLPYKASMWDSLESVYLAVCEDEFCEAYVMPIPYFDKNPDKSFRKMHYEGDLFPSDIPITDYRTYDIEERRPDVIYIHNPYDEYNFVTSVHPAYYSSKLKELTEQLVYIPYFVLGEIDPESDKALEAVKKFAIVPGIVNAHKVILESQAVRQAYITTLVGEFGENTRNYWESKIEGTGSPKYARIARLKREDFEIPPEWQKIMMRENGSRKKVILYNTSVNALLANEEKMLDKMQDVFQFFKENKEHVALLWRPHPLIRATIESLRPRLWERYYRMVEDYKKENWGIYDDTVELDRAIVLSDAYYGDHSSLVALYQKTGKMIMIQNKEILFSAKRNIAFLFGCAADYDIEAGILWIMTQDSAMLLKIDANTGEVNNYYSVPVGKIEGNEFVNIKVIGNEIFLIPYDSDRMFYFHIKEETFSEIELPLCEEEWKSKNKFGKMICTSDYIYMVGGSVKCIIKLDFVKKEARRIEWGGEKLASDGILYNQKIYIPCAIDNIIVKLDIEHDSCEKIILENCTSNGFDKVYISNQKLYLIDRAHNRMYCELNDIERECAFLKVIYEESIGKKCYRIIGYNQKNFFFYRFEKNIYVLEGGNDYKCISSPGAENSNYTKEGNKYYGFVSQKGNLIFMQVSPEGLIYMLDMNTNKIKKIGISISEDLLDQLIKSAWENMAQNVIEENDSYNLLNFSRYIEIENGIE